MRNAGSVDSGEECLRETFDLDFFGHQIDRKSNSIRPTPGLGQCSGNQVSRQPRRKALLLGHGKQRTRAYFAELRMLPAAKRLGPDQALFRQGELGLEHGFDLAPFHRAGEFGAPGQYRGFYPVGIRHGRSIAAGSEDGLRQFAGVAKWHGPP